MAPSVTHADSVAALSSGQISPVASAPAEGAVALPQGVSVGRRSPSRESGSTRSPLAGSVALAALVLGSAAVVAFATGSPSTLVPRTFAVFPAWEAGPLHLLTGGLHVSWLAIKWGLSGLMVAMLLAYLVALAAARSLSARTIVLAVVALHVILLLSPPLLLTDLFNYLGYARLGGLHGLNPYQNVIAQEMHDPVYAFATWRHLHSPYGPLFTALTYPLARLPLPAAYWLLKVLTVAASLGFLGLVWSCARRLGRDPRLAIAFVALNPLYLVYGLGGFHNDFFMLLPSMAAIALVLSERDRHAGALLVLAVAIKFTAIAPVAFHPAGRGSVAAAPAAACPGRRRLAVPLVAGYLLLFGATIPNLSDQTTLVTPFSVPNLAVWLFSGGSLILHADDRCRSGSRGGSAVAPPGLDLRGRMGHPGPACRPGVADAVVHRLGPAAGGDRRKQTAAAGGARRHRVPAHHVLACGAGLGRLLPARYPPGAGLSGPADPPRAVASTVCGSFVGCSTYDRRASEHTIIRRKCPSLASPVVKRPATPPVRRRARRRIGWLRSDLVAGAGTAPAGAWPCRLGAPTLAC